MEMKFHWIHLVMCNRILCNMYCTLIVTIYHSWCFEWKTKFTHDMLNPYHLYANIHYTIILYLYVSKRDRFFIFTTPNYGSRNKTKHITKCRLHVVTMFIPIQFKVIDQIDYFITTILYNNLVSALDITNNSLYGIKVTFS
jgi:hypothetical protein